VTRRFGGFTALDSVDFAVRAGEIHALLGENGAGKSTLMNLLSGLLRPTAGEILLDGAPVRFTSPRDAAAAGIGMVHQHFLLVPPLTVRENLLLGAAPTFGGLLSYPAEAVRAEAQALADALGWAIPWDAPAGDLPVGTQQRVEILKALRGHTRVLIFDEPTAVLTPTETPELFETIRRLARDGRRGVVFISHKLDEVLALSDTVTVLRRGRVVHRTPTAQTDARRLAAAMVGAETEEKGAAAEAPAAPRTAPRGNRPGLRGDRPLLQVIHLTLHRRGRRAAGAAEAEAAARPLLRDLTFSVAPGEIFGIAGVDGNGQAELADCLAGLVRPDAGRILIAGEEPARGPAAFRRAGVAVIPADRQRRGLALPLSLTENLALGVHDAPAFRCGPLLLWPRLRARARDLIREYDVRATGPSIATRALSGGNQQKVVIARALSGRPRVIVAVNPTRGLDVNASAFVHRTLRRAAEAEGAAVVLVSTELDEVLALASDRVAVLYAGAFSGIVSPSAPRERIGLLMGGGGDGNTAGPLLPPPPTERNDDGD
jgi:simple sugar transport system ATP-binding protein